MNPGYINQIDFMQAMRNYQPEPSMLVAAIANQPSYAHQQLHPTNRLAQWRSPLELVVNESITV